MLNPELIQEAKNAILSTQSGYPQRSVIYYGECRSEKMELLNCIESMANAVGALCCRVDTSSFKKTFIEDAMNLLKNDIEYWLLTDLTDILVCIGKSAKRSKKVVCFLSADLHLLSTKDLGELISAIHRCNQLRLPIILFGTGHTKILRSAGNARSYAERLFEFREI